MGRHADPDARHFWRSLGSACLRATAALALVAGLFAAVASLGRVPEDGPVVLGGPDPETDTGSGLPGPSPEATVEPAQDAVELSGAPEPPQDPVEPPADADTPEALIAAAPPPEETTVQVLDGVGASPRLPALVASLEELGYDVVATNPASTAYPVTTVFFTDGSEPAARALQARDSRIVERRPSPGLSTEVDLHVVLGADWQAP